MHDDENPSQVEGSTPAVSTHSPRASRGRTGVIVIAVIVLLGVAAIFVAIVMRPTAIERAGEKCVGVKPLDNLIDGIRGDSTPTPLEEPAKATESDRYVELFDGVVSVEDKGATLIVKTKPRGDDPLGLTSLSLDCIYEELQVPTRITERISVTRSIDGRQEGEWDGYSASWSYHPDSGANLIIAKE